MVSSFLSSCQNHKIWLLSAILCMNKPWVESCGLAGLVKNYVCFASLRLGDLFF